jgi:hypothetical protein
MRIDLNSMTPAGIALRLNAPATEAMSTFTGTVVPIKIDPPADTDSISLKKLPGGVDLFWRFDRCIHMFSQYGIRSPAMAPVLGDPFVRLARGDLGKDL